MLTPDIKVGDSVPVTMELCRPPVTMEHIDVSNYLPKSEYIYGSDYNKAIDMMKDAMVDCDKIPSGWWNENNNNAFTLPYTKKSSLQRCSIRSNQENIKNGYVFPYGARRNNTLIPDKFELNEENGIFIGLFLAEGHATDKIVQITKQEPEIQRFVKNWFDKHQIKH